MTPTIRRFKAADEAALLDVLAEGLRAQEGYAAQVDPPEDEGFYQREWSACVEALHNAPQDWWVAVEGGEVVGLLWLEQTSDLFVPYHTVQQVAVTPARRGQGIGGALLDFAAGQARAAGSMLVMIGGLVSNPAMDLYRRRSFEPVPEGYHGSGDNPNHVLMWKRFEVG